MSEDNTNRRISSDSNRESGIQNERAEDEEFLLVETFFEDGPLGVTLRRRAEDGIVFVFDIVAGSQAVNLDVIVGDELWGVAQTEIGNTPLDKEAWNGLIQFIKQSPRPLRLIWRRRPPIEPEHHYHEDEVIEHPSMQPEPPQPKPPAAPSHSLLELQRLIARLVSKEGGSKKLNGPQPDFTQLLMEGRQILRTGELSGGSKTTLWMKTEIKRYLILLTDLLIICTPTPGNMFQVDNIVDLQTCKVRSNGVRIAVEGNPHGPPNSFEVLYPGGSVELVAESAQMRDVWVTNIYLAVCDCVGESERVLGWRHQYLLGTMHSAVLCRDENRVRELVAMCEAGQMEFSSIEAQDADGYTPLHYACMLKMHNMVKILHEASCDVTATDMQGLSSVHWAALRLDDYAMSLLCSHIFDVDLLDRRDRTPLQLACIEGRDLSGKTDPQALKKCVATLLTHQPNVNVIDRYGVTLLHHLSASWQFEALELLLEAGADVNFAEYQFSMCPIHYVANATPIKLNIGEAARIINRLDEGGNGSGGESPSLKEPEPLNRPHGAATLRALLLGGARPNGRDRLNRGPLHIIAEPERDAKWGSEELCEAVSLLISFGARMDDTPLLTNLRMRYPDINYAALAEKWASLPVINGDKLDVRYNQYVSDDSTHSVSVDKSNSNNGSSPPRVSSGSDCVLCSFQFTMFKRQHHCRLCNASCCDDCSKKRVVIDGSQARVCDSCYNRVLNLQAKANQRELISSMRPLNNRSAELMGDSTFSSNRDKLLGSRSGDGGSGQKSGTAGRSAGGGSSSTGLNATMSTMSEAHERLQERGEKLAKLSDRTEEMSNQANEFARMAKQLNEQQRSRWF